MVAARDCGPAGIGADGCGMAHPPDYERLVTAARLELEAAGNPAYVTVVCTGGGTIVASPLVFASIGPSSDHAAHVAHAADEGEQVFIVSRHAQGRRQILNVLAPFTLKKLHTQHEVIEQSLVDTYAV
jgi:hypothetical protein